MKSSLRKLSLRVLLSATVIFSIQSQLQAQIKLPKLPKVPSVPKPSDSAPPSNPASAEESHEATENADNSGNDAPKPVSKQKNNTLYPGQPDPNLNEPQVSVPSISFLPRTVPGYYSSPNSEQNTAIWSWTPRISFTIQGPVESGSVINVQYTLPDGSAWTDHDCPTQKAGKGVRYKVEGGQSIPEKKGTLQTGVFGFKIHLKNELQGTDKILYSGKFKIEKFVYNPTNIASAAKHYVYYINSDWKLPAGYVFVPASFNYAGGGDEYNDHAPLIVQMWFKGKSEIVYNMTAHLFYNGKEVAATNAYGSNTVTDETNEVASQTSSDGEYTAKNFWFNALVFDHVNDGSYMGYQLFKNPGEYEVKVLQNGKLARTAKFTIDATGNIVNNGLNTKLGTTRILIPVKVLGDQDGTWNKNAWQTEGFFSNPISGFSPQ